MKYVWGIHRDKKFQRQWDNKKFKGAKERGSRSEDTKGKKAISRKVKRDTVKNKGCPIMQISFLGKGEPVLIALFFLI